MSRAWTEEELARFKELWEAGHSVKVIARMIDRSPASVIHQREKRDLTPRKRLGRARSYLCLYLPKALKAKVAQRAVEAKLTTSAYIRRCIWDAELARIQWNPTTDSTISSTPEEKTTGGSGGLATPSSLTTTSA